LAWRRVSHRTSNHHSSLDFTLDSSSSSSSLDSPSVVSSGSSSDSLSDSSSVHSSGCDASGQSHSGPSTRVLSPRLVDPPVRTPRCSEAFIRWRSVPLSTLYPPTTSESSQDSSFWRSIAPALVDLPPRKRFRASYLSEASGEEHMEIGTADAETVTDLGVSDGVRAPTEDGLGMGVEISTSDIREDKGEFEVEASAGGTMEIVVDPLVTGGISEPTGGDAPNLKEAGQLVASEERAGLADKVRSLGWENLRVRALLCIERDGVDSLRRHMVLSHEEFRQVHRDCDNTQRRLRRTMTITRSGMTPEAIEELVNRRVEEALTAYEATHAANALEAKSQSQNGSNDDNGNGGNGNAGNRNGENGNPNENDRG
ncbi:hypothetical protein Tco_1197619, partial [Tanacetum coccineum]